MISEPKINIQNCSILNLRAISAALSRNDLTAVLGPAGSGKSALLIYSILAESTRRLGRMIGAAPGRSAAEFEDLRNSDLDSALLEIDPVVPVVDLNSRFHALSSTLSVGEYLGLTAAAEQIFSFSGTRRCPNDNGVMSELSAEKAVEKLSAGHLSRFESKGSRTGIQTILICKPIGKVPLKKPAAVKLGIEDAFSAGVRRFVVGGKYLRCSSDSDVASVFAAWRNDTSNLPLTVSETVSISDNDAADLKSELTSVLRRYSAAGSIIIVPSAGNGRIDWAGRAEYAPKVVRCERCRYEVYVNDPRRYGNSDFPKKFDLELGGQMFSALKCANICGPEISAVFRGLSARELVLPGIRAAAELLPLLNESGLGSLRLNQPLRTLSSGERILLLLAVVAGAEASGLLFLLSHITGFFSPAEDERFLRLFGRIFSAGNGLVLEERDLKLTKARPVSGRYIRLGPGGGSRGGQLQGQGPIIDLCGTDETKKKPAAADSSRQSGAALVSITVANRPSADIYPGSLVQIRGKIGTGKSVLLRHLAEAIAARKKRKRGVRQIKKSADPGSQSEFGSSMLTRSQFNWSTEFSRSCAVVLKQENPQIIGRKSGGCVERLASLLGVERGIAQLFSETGEARRAGLPVEAFLFKSEIQRCAECRGRGASVTDLQPLGRVRRRCQVCGGSGFSAAVLGVEYRGVSFGSVILSELVDVAGLFAARRNIVERCRAAAEFQLGYLRLSTPVSQLLNRDVAIIELIELLFSRNENARQRRRALVLLIDLPIFSRDVDDNRLVIGLLRRLLNSAETPGIAFVATPDINLGPEIDLEIPL